MNSLVEYMRTPLVINFINYPATLFRRAGVFPGILKLFLAISLACVVSTEAKANEDPVLVSSIGSQAGTEGTAFGPLDVSGNFSDPDNDPLTFSVSGLPVGTGLSIKATTGIISGRPTQSDADASPMNVTVIASDGQGGNNAQDSFSLTIADLDLIEGYLSAFSVTQGASIDLYTSTSALTYDVDIYKVGVERQLIASYQGLSGVEYPIPDSAWHVGAQWLNPLQVNIPTQWVSGLYEIWLRTNDDTTNLYFSVKEDDPGSISRILVVDNAPTRVAYNNWGGKSLYPFNSSDRIRASSVSLFRPGQNMSRATENEIAGWLEYMNIPVEHASMLDLHIDPAFLNDYDLLLISGHSEYWSKAMRDAFDAFVQGGGKALIMSGNTMYWQVRLEGNNLVSYKANAIANDPMYGVDNTVVTTNWAKDPVNDPENRSIGVGWRNGGYIDEAGFYPASEGYGGYTVSDAEHTLFNGTGLQNGDVFGQPSGAAAGEVDGAIFNWVDGKPVVTGEDGTPLNFEILAYAPAATPSWTGNATMGVFEVGTNGGAVFNAATMGWVSGLWDQWLGIIPDPLVSKITLNVLAQFNSLGPIDCSAPPSGAQIDSDNDGIGDVCDNCVLAQNPDQADTDSDGTGNACDLDSDNDGLEDSFEQTIGTDPLSADTDGDTLSDFLEVAYDGDPYAYITGQDLNPNSSDTDADGHMDAVDPIPLTFNFDDGDLAPIGIPDGVINAGDYLLALQISMGQRTATEQLLAHGDLYPANAPDGVINAQDALLLIQRMLGSF